MMLITTTLMLQLALAGPDTLPVPAMRFAPPAAPTASYLAITTGRLAELAPDDTTRPRPRAIVYSDWYTRRFTIHKWASWAMLPLVAGEYVVGQKLYNGTPGTQGGLRDTHQLLATGIEGLFAVNTVTGVWNLWDSRHDPHGRTRRWVHGISMLVADVGYLAAAGTAPDDDCAEGGGTCAPNSQRASTHRGLAIGAFGLSTVSWLMMLVWKD
ncbi:MAG TPA: hypothetical protein VFI13_01145 [Gemmatimonadales bacterium]|nr:hypothetical protein [Gemmatimonadales bacterium]